MISATSLPPFSSKVTVRVLPAPMVQALSAPCGALSVPFTRTVTVVSAGKVGDFSAGAVLPCAVSYLVLHGGIHTGHLAVALVLNGLIHGVNAGCSGAGRDIELRPVGGIVGISFGFAYVQRLAEMIGDGAAGYLRAAALRGVDLVTALYGDGLSRVVDGVALANCGRGLAGLDDVEIDRGFAGVVAGEVDGHAAGADIDVCAIAEGVVPILDESGGAELHFWFRFDLAAGVGLVGDVRDSETAAVIALGADSHGHGVTVGAGRRAAAGDRSGDGAAIGVTADGGVCGDGIACAGGSAYLAAVARPLIGVVLPCRADAGRERAAGAVGQGRVAGHGDSGVGDPLRGQGHVAGDNGIKIPQRVAVIPAREGVASQVGSVVGLVAVPPFCTF